MRLRTPSYRLLTIFLLWVTASYGRIFWDA
jgi:hypothetical protein